MQGKQVVIDTLNAALTIELTAINQYIVQSQMCRNWSLNRLGSRLQTDSELKSQHSRRLVDRIIFLEGVPEIGRYEMIRVGGTVEKHFSNDLLLEAKAAQIYNIAVQTCFEAQDAGSRLLVESLLVETERQLDWLESQIDLINKVGLQNYLTHQIGDF